MPYPICKGSEREKLLKFNIDQCRCKHISFAVESHKTGMLPFRRQFSKIISDSRSAWPTILDESTEDKKEKTKEKAEDRLEARAG